MQQAVLSIADLIVRSPLVRWTWSGFADHSFARALTEFRPADPETVHEMMAGRYVLASKLVDTHGVSPFTLETVSPAWRAELHSFSWLRHFDSARGDAERRFARTLVLDWIGRNAHFDARSWVPTLTAIRVLNWLRHPQLISEGGTAEQKRTVMRALNTQLQSLRLRGGLSMDPLDALFAAIALLGAALCMDKPGAGLANRARKLKLILDEHIAPDGLHKSRNPAVQFNILTELTTVVQALGQRSKDLAVPLSATMQKMHDALHMMTLGNGELAYFNGCGQLPVDLVLAVQSQNGTQGKRSGLVSGYGVLAQERATVILDSGPLPQIQFGADAHAGALSFEFSHGSDLVVGNCGPAPAELVENRVLFRQGAAHSGPTIDGVSSARISVRGPQAGRLHGGVGTPELSVDDDEGSLHAATRAFGERFGVVLERNLTLMSDGDTLVGQDRMRPSGRGRGSGTLCLRFHLAPGAEVFRRRGEDIIQIKLRSGAQWTFLWEGAAALVDESVRQSAYFGFFRTRQIVLETDIVPGDEVSWIFTKQSG